MYMYGEHGSTCMYMYGEHGSTCMYMYGEHGSTCMYYSKHAVVHVHVIILDYPTSTPHI